MNIKQMITMCEHAMERSDDPDSATITLIMAVKDINAKTWEYAGVKGIVKSNNGVSARVEFKAAKLHRAATETWKDAFKTMDQYFVYGQANCPQCVDAKALLDKAGEKYTYVDLTKDLNRKVKLYEETNAKSMPIIFRNGKFFGSVYDLKRYLEGA
jgi:glutaredoxin 3